MDKIILLTGDDGVGKDLAANKLVESIDNAYISSIKSSCVKIYKNLVGVDWDSLKGAEKRIHRPIFSNLCEGIKITLGKGVFAEETVKKIKLAPFKKSLFIVPDVRFVEEYNVFNDNFDVILIEVIRNEGKYIGDNLSEYIEFTINNKGDLENLQFEVDRFIDEF